MKDCKHCHQRPSLLDDLCKLCFDMLLLQPLRKEIARAKDIINICESNRVALARRLFEAEQLSLKIERTEARLASEKPWACKCGMHFQYENAYRMHAFSCTGEYVEPKSVQAARASRAKRNEAMKEISMEFFILALSQHEAQQVRVALTELRRHRPELISQEQLIGLMKEFE